jgi:hypothetical protein
MPKHLLTYLPLQQRQALPVPQYDRRPSQMRGRWNGSLRYELQRIHIGMLLLSVRLEEIGKTLACGVADLVSTYPLGGRSVADSSQDDHKVLHGKNKS